MKIIITISGPSGAMKSPMARTIARAIGNSRPDLSCTIFDHQLFEFDDNFEDCRASVFHDARHSEHEVCIVVIGTGDDNVMQIEVEPAIPGVVVLFNALDDHVGGDA